MENLQWTGKFFPTYTEFGPRFNIRTWSTNAVFSFISTDGKLLNMLLKHRWSNRVNSSISKSVSISSVVASVRIAHKHVYSGCFTTPKNIKSNIKYKAISWQHTMYNVRYIEWAKNTDSFDIIKFQRSLKRFSSSFSWNIIISNEQKNIPSKFDPLELNASFKFK